MKRMFASLAITGLALTGLTACGGNQEDGKATGGETENVSLSVWAPQEDQADGASWLADMEKAFAEAHPEYKITWKNDVVSEGDALTKVKTDPSAAADVYMFANDQLGTLVDLGAIGQLGEKELAQVKEQNDPSMIDSVTGVDGNVYGVPFTGNTWFMYYDSTKITADEAKSLDAMIAKTKVSFPINNSWNIPAFYVEGANLKFFGEKGTDASKGIVFNDLDKATAVTNYLTKLVANSNFVSDSEGSGLAALQSGDTAVYFSGTWDAQNVKEALGDGYAATQLPTFKLNGEDVQMKSFAGSKAIAYNPNASNVKAAAQFAAFLGSTQAQKAHYEARGIVPTDKSLATAVADDDFAAQAQIATISNTSIVQPTIPAMNGWWDPAKAFGDGLLNKEITESNSAEKMKAWADQTAAMVG